MPLQHRLHGMKDFLAILLLKYNPVHACFLYTPEYTGRAVSGQYEYFDFRKLLFDCLDKFKTIFSRHVEVRNQQVRDLLVH